MKRSNGFLLGTLAVILFAGVLVIQARVPGPGANEHPESVPTGEGENPNQMGVKASSQMPTMETLQNEVRDQQAGPKNVEGTIPGNEKFKPPANDSTLPSSRWYEGSRTPTNAEETAEQAKRTGNAPR